jgi:transcription elongation factor Elf1
MDTQSEYIRRHGAECPVCQSNQIEGGFIEIAGNTARQHVHCLECGASWDADYNLVGYSNLQTVDD